MSDEEHSEPSPLSASGIPSSFDSSPEFFEESRTQKLFRKIKQEPLIPVGCAATVYALYQATKSIRHGDHHQTNKMFRARIYAQGFTLVALVAGSIFYRDERMQRKKFEGAIEKKKASEKREKWIKELEARDEEDRIWRERIEGRLEQTPKETMAGVKNVVEDKFPNKSITEEVHRAGWGKGAWASRISDAWKRA